MRNYSEAEKCMLLLFAPLGVERPLSRRAYQGIAKAIAALGSGDGGSRRDVTRRDLERLGASEEDAGCILDRLEQEDVLEQYLRKLRGQGITPLTRVTLEYPRRLRQVLGSHASMLLYCAGNLRLFGNGVRFAGGFQAAPDARVALCPDFRAHGGAGAADLCVRRRCRRGHSGL